MARGRRRERRRREDSSNRRLPTFSPTRAGITLPDYTLPQALDVYPEVRFQFNAPIPIAVPEPTAKVPLSKAAFQPTRVSEGRKRSPRRQAKLGANASPIESGAQKRARSLPADECVRRSQRTEVIHALGHAGQSGQKSPRWTKRSKIKC